MEQIVLDFNKIEMCKELTNTQRILIKKIHLLSKNEGFCYASNKGLANMMAMSASGIAKVVTRLVELGFINRVITKENGNERHITLTKKCIDMFKKVSETVKNAGNNIKPKNPPKPNTPNTPEQPQQSDFTSGIPTDELLEQDQPCLDFINHDLFVKHYGNPSKKIIELEKAYGIYEFNTVLSGSLNTKVDNIEAYFAGSLKNNRNKLNQGMHIIKSGANIKRREQVPSWLEENTNGWNNVHNNKEVPQNVSNELKDEENDIFERLALISQIPANTNLSKSLDEYTNEELKSIIKISQNALSMFNF